MKKSYDRTVTPQNTPHISKFKIFFVLTVSMIVLNFIVCAFLSKEIRIWALLAAGVFAIMILLQLFDVRKQEWSAWSLLSWVLILIIVSVLFVNFSDKTLFLWILFAELAVLGIMVCILFSGFWKAEHIRKKRLQKRRAKREQK